MRIPRLTLMDFMIVLAVLALVGSIPIQYQATEKRAFRQYLIDRTRIVGDRIQAISEDPAPWMDEFRPEMRRLIQTYREALASAEATGSYPILNPNDSIQYEFWVRFDPVARRQGYEPPRLAPMPNRVRTLGGDLALIWPLILAGLLLPCLGPFRRLVRSRRLVETP